MACERHRIDLDRIGDDEFPYVFNPQQAQIAIDFFPAMLTHNTGEWAGRPFELSPSQKFIVWSMFGWLDAEGYRRFRRVFITVARKWGKSTFCSGLSILFLYGDWPVEVNSQVYVAATKQEQAAIVHREAVLMILKNKLLKKQAKISKWGSHYKSVLLPFPPYNGSVFKPLVSDSSTSDGFNPAVVIKDEWHAWKPQHKGLKDRIETAGGSRRQPIDITISTEGDEQSTFYIQDLDTSVAMLEAACDRGEHINDRLFAFVAKMDEERPGPDGEMIAADDPFEEENWYKANPDLGVTPKLEYIREQAERAKQEPHFLNSFLRFHCNVRVSSKVKLINPAAWSACYNRDIPWEQAEAICGAFDLGWRDDLASVGVAARFNIDGEVKYGFMCKNFACENPARKLADEPWRTWQRLGYLIVTNGNTTDLTEIEDWILRLSDEKSVHQWRFDPKNALQIGQNLTNRYGKLAVEFPQHHNRYNEPLRELMKQIVDGNMWHDGDQVLAWAVDNAVGKKNGGGQIMPDKERSKDKIDPFVAMVMAFSGVMAGLDEPVHRGDYYETNALEIG